MPRVDPVTNFDFWNDLFKAVDIDPHMVMEASLTQNWAAGQCHAELTVKMHYPYSQLPDVKKYKLTIEPK